MRVQRRAGRPLRFLALTLGGWAAARVILLWPVALPGPLVGPQPALAASIPARWSTGATAGGPIAPPPGAFPPMEREIALAAPAPAARQRSPSSPVMAGFALAADVRDDPAVAPGFPTDAHGTIPPPLRPTPIAAGRSRLAGSAWLIARGGMGTAAGGALTGGQLGASQAGARLTYALGPQTEGVRRLALSARIATPLRGHGAEAAVGLDWQPTRLPLHLLAEQRVSLDGGRGGPALLAVGGIDPTPLGGGLRLEGYAQAGAIARPSDAGGVEAFGDGAARLTHPLAAIGAAKIDLGAGAWGAAQRGVRRLDLGRRSARRCRSRRRRCASRSTGASASPATPAPVRARRCRSAPTSRRVSITVNHHCERRRCAAIRGIAEPRWIASLRLQRRRRAAPPRPIDPWPPAARPL